MDRYVPTLELCSVLGSLLSSPFPALIDSIVEIPSAQQHVYLVTARTAPSRRPSTETPDADTEAPSSWQFVVRVWTGCARWWNLNLTLPPSSLLTSASSSSTTNSFSSSSSSSSSTSSSSSPPDISDFAISNPLTIAEAEVAGYRLARKAFSLVPVPPSSPFVSVPEVLYCSFSSSTLPLVSAPFPYCILSYVGAPLRAYSRSPITTMIKNRVEFGFLEPHPRHGRVPNDRCLEYALLLLEAVVRPIQALEPHESDTIATTETTMKSPFTAQKMLRMYAAAAAFFERRWLCPSAESQPPSNPFLSAAASAFSKCATALTASFADIADLPARLCHCDLQPQNLLFHRTASQASAADPGGDFENAHELPTPFPQPAFVLDWEDSCVADPRFEVLLICRKVVADLTQARVVWSTFSSLYNSSLSHSSSFTHGYSSSPAAPPQESFVVGPLEPWLLLEGVHSVATLLLQWARAGGRSSWEMEKDLEGKIGREFARMRLIGGEGWDFLKLVEAESE